MSNRMICREEFTYTLESGSTLLTLILDLSEMFRNGDSYTPVTYLLGPEDLSTYRKVGTLANDKIFGGTK